MQRRSLCRLDGRLDGRGPRGRRGQESAEQLRQGHPSNTRARAEEKETATAGHENEASPRGLKLNERPRRARRVWQPGGEAAPDKIVTREPCKGCVEGPSMGTGKVLLSCRTLGSELALKAKRSCQSKASKLASKGQRTAGHAGTRQSATHTASDVAARSPVRPVDWLPDAAISIQGSPTPCHHPPPASRHSSAVIDQGKQESTKRWCKIWSRFLHPHARRRGKQLFGTHRATRARDQRIRTESQEQGSRAQVPSPTCFFKGRLQGLLHSAIPPWSLFFFLSFLLHFEIFGHARGERRSQAADRHG